MLPPMPWGPSMGLRLWRFAAGVCRRRGGREVEFRCSSVAAMGLLTVFWDINASPYCGSEQVGFDGAGA